MTTPQHHPPLHIRFYRWWTLADTAPETDPVRAISLGATAIAVAVISYGTLRHLGLRLGFDPVAAALFPLAFDLAVLGSTRAWLHPRLSDATRHYAAAVALITIAASIIGNGVEHLYESAASSVWWTVAVISFSSFMPFVLGLVIHLVAMVGTDRRRRIDGEVARAARRTAVPAARIAEVTNAAATGTDGAAVTRPVTDIGAPRDRIFKVIQEQLVAGRTVGGRGADVSWAEIDRLAGTNGLAKKVGPGMLDEPGGDQS